MPSVLEPEPAETVTVTCWFPPTPVGVAGVFGVTGAIVVVVVAWSLPAETGPVETVDEHEPALAIPLLPQ